MGRAHEVRKVAMAKTAAIKSKLYAKYGKEIYMTAKSGTPDPEANQALKKIIEKAKRENVPVDVIKRAIEKAKGGSEENYTLCRYEGFGPSNCLVIVDCLSDNTTRTYAEVRNCFTKTFGKLGVSGACMHMFKHVGIISVTGYTDEEILEALIEADASIIDIVADDDLITIETLPVDFDNTKDALLAFDSDIEIISDDVTFLPLQEVTLEGDSIEKFQKLIDMLNNLEDVQDIYHNVIENE